MDIQLVTAAFVTFLFFLLTIAILFRITKPEAAIVWTIRAFVGVGIVSLSYFIQRWEPVEILFWASLYGLLSTLFIFGIFSIMEASLTLRIFTEIGDTPEGITTAALMKKHNRNLIIERRIARLVYSGELVKRGGSYIFGKMSYFKIREYLLRFLRFAFQ